MLSCTYKRPKINMKSTTFKHKSSPGHKRKNGLLLFALIIGLLLVVGIGLYIVSRNKTAQQAAQEKTQSEAQTDSSKKTNQSMTDSPSKEAGAGMTDRVSEDIPINSSLLVTLDPLTQSGGYVRSSLSITGATDRGTCSFTFATGDTQPVARSTPSTTANGGQVCSIEIPEVEFAKTGTWNLTGRFFTINSKAEANQSVTIN